MMTTGLRRARAEGNGVGFSRVTEPGIERSVAYRSARLVAVNPVRWMVDRDWQGIEHLPGPGRGCIVAANHISNADPFAVADFLYRNGHPPFFLAKDSLFRIPVLGRWLAATGQVPVYRGTGQARGAYDDAVAAVKAGRTIVVMPEGTITRDPDGWPMRAKTGAVRIALAADAPLVPLGQWGAQDLLPRGARFPRLHPRPTMHMRVGPPVDLSDLSLGDLDHGRLMAASDRVMQAITDQVAAIRGENAPAGRWDSSRGERVRTEETS